MDCRVFCGDLGKNLPRYKGMTLYLVSGVDTDGLVHQGVSNYSAEYAPVHFQLLMW